MGSGLEHTDQGIVLCIRRVTTVRGPACEPSKGCRFGWGPLGPVPGCPELFNYVSLVDEVPNREPCRRSGGDEETRTPDPLLAKEMLCQLSYVPVTCEVCGKWWAHLDSNQGPRPYQGRALTN